MVEWFLLVRCLICILFYKIDIDIDIDIDTDTDIEIDIDIDIDVDVRTCFLIQGCIMTCCSVNRPFGSLTMVLSNRSVNFSSISNGNTNGSF